MRRTLAIGLLMLGLGVPSLVVPSLGQMAKLEFVTPLAPIPIFRTPPGAFFQGKGVPFETAHPNERCEVLERRTVPAFTSSEVWLRIRIVRGSSSIDGWIFARREGSGDANVKNLP
jgi:hypothetical protein